MSIALIGNQNSGKTTLFNELTGLNQHVGNFPGVTVEQKSGIVRGERDLTVVDLPGIYSLSPYTAEELVTRSFLLEQKPSLVLNIVDATSLERSLYLTLQLMELGLPMVVALNMMDEVEENGIKIDVPVLEDILGIPIIPISASRGTGIEALLGAVRTGGRTPKNLNFYNPPIHTALAHLTGGIAPDRFSAVKLLEGDSHMERRLNLSEAQALELRAIREGLDAALPMDREASFADLRYQTIDAICARAVKRQGETLGRRRSTRIDAALTHRIFGIPIFLGILFLIFWLTFGVLGEPLSDLLSAGIDRFGGSLNANLLRLGTDETLRSLVIDGVVPGVGSVLSFLPIIVILFFFLSLLEDSGYMARVAFLMDGLLRKLGLSGRSLVPMLIGFGCSVPAIMATRTLGSDRDRKMTILLIPFMSCSAKLPIYSLFTFAFFPEHRAIVMIALYVFGIIIGILVSFLLRHTLFRGESVPFLMELPEYRLPAPKSIGLHIWQNARDFIVKAFTIIFAAAIVVWFLGRYDFALHVVADGGDSILASIGRLLTPILAPLGFGDWRVSTALVTGLTAKETVIATLAVLLGAGEAAGLPPLLTQLFTPLSAFSFLIFTLLYMPCVAAMAAVRRELGGMWRAAGVMLFQTGVAWVVAFVVYRIGLLLT